MGICASCLGLRRRNSYDPENSRLLYSDDLYQNGYGTLHNAPNGIAQQDPRSAKREEEALERITQRTSDSIIDIFAMRHAHEGVTSPERTKSTNFDSLVKNVWRTEAMRKQRASILDGDVYASRSESEPDEEWGTVKRSRQGDLIRQITLD